MERVARLVQASGDVRRKLWASLPVSVRLAEAFVKVAVTTTEAFGKTIYGEFLLHHVEGMPDINGTPASDFDLTRKPIANRLPRGYGKDFGEKVYRTLVAKFRSPSLAEEVMMNFMMKFLGGKDQHFKDGQNIKAAQYYILTAVTREAMNTLRNKNNRREDSMTMPNVEEGEDTLLDVSVMDEDTVESILRQKMPKMKGKLEAIHPDAPLYVQLSVLEGYSDREIIGDVAHGVPSLLPNPVSKSGKPLTQQSWDMTYKDKIFDVLKKNFAEYAAH